MYDRTFNKPQANTNVLGVGEYITAKKTSNPYDNPSTEKNETLVEPWETLVGMRNLGNSCYMFLNKIGQLNYNQ